MQLMWFGVLVLAVTVTAEVSTSVYKLAVLCHKEGKLLQALDHYVSRSLENQTCVDKNVRRYLKHIKEERSKIDDVAEWVGHPINAFHLVERTVNGWREVQQSISCGTCPHSAAAQEFNSTMKEIVEEDGLWTSSNDLILAGNGLGRITKTYALDLKTVISGIIFNTSASPLTSSDVINIAEHLRVDDRIKWYETYLQLGDVIEKEAIVYKLAMTYHMEGLSKKALSILPNQHLAITHPMANTIMIIRQEAEAIEEDKPLQRPEELYADLKRVFGQMCQKSVQREMPTPALHCYSKVTRVPYYTVKEEVLSYIPRISRFHDVISDGEILQILTTAKQDLERAHVADDNGDGSKSEDVRVGEVHDLSSSNKLALKLEKRIELLTGLAVTNRQNVTVSETFKVVNYGLGGHFLNHYDPFDRRNRSEITDGSYSYGDRMATWVFYFGGSTSVYSMSFLSDNTYHHWEINAYSSGTFDHVILDFFKGLNEIKEGGATIFPKLDLWIPPIKKSAVIWYNLLPSGELDHRSQHASCPVILGTKWVMTKIVRERGQESRRPCKTHPMGEHF